MSESAFLLEFKEQAVFRINENTPRIKRCLDLLTEEQIWSKPNDSSNSIANLILHLSGNITQYILSSLASQPDIRNRDFEFEAENSHSKDELWTLISNTCKQACDAIMVCEEKELLRSRMVQGFELSGTGIVMHVVEHYSYHTGQIALITKLIRNVDLGFYADHDLNIKND